MVDGSNVTGNRGITHRSILPLPAIYFASGIPALVYQTVWQRLLVLHSGVGTTSVAIIVAAYLFGIGVGNVAGARLSRSRSRSQALKLFARLEITIGVCGILSPWLLYDLLYVRYGTLYGDIRIASMLHFAVLILPTTLMGATLPLITRALVRRTTSAARSVSLLYGMNTLGAAFGAVLAPWCLIPYVGMTGALMGAAILNVLVAGLASREGNSLEEMNTPHRIDPDSPTSDSRRRTPATVSATSTPFGVWILLYFFGGLCAIGLEIVWFRILDVAVKSTSYTFGTVLGTYLCCMAVGSIAGAYRSDRIRYPLRTFLWIQIMIVAGAAGMVSLLVLTPPDTPGFDWFVRYWASEEPIRPSLVNLGATVRLYVVLPMVLMGFPTFLMGYSFSVLQKGVQCDVAQSGYRVGLLQGANIAGCTSGSLVAGLWLINVLGTMNTLRLILFSGIVFAIVGLRLPGSRRLFGTGFAGITMLALCLPGNNSLWMRLHGQQPDDRPQFAEDATGVCALTLQKSSGNWWMWANGKTQSLLPFGGFHSKLGILPVTLHRSPRSVAIIGLGSGDTAWAAGCRSTTGEIRVFEICTAELELLQKPFSSKKWPQVKQLLNDRRVRIDGTDARFALMSEDRTYDVIEADAIRHHGAYAGYLYSVEFFQLCGRRLNQGGFMCSWSPTPLTHATFRRAFPHVLELENGLLLIGSNEPIEADTEEWSRRIESTQEYIGETLTRECVQSILLATSASGSHPSDWWNTDLFPYDEFN